MHYRKFIAKASIPWMAALVATAVVIAGCGDQTVLNSTETTPPPPFHPIYTGSSERGVLDAKALWGDMATAESSTSWFVVGEGYAHPKKALDIVSDKCVLNFKSGDVDSRTLITISMYDTSILDFEFAPHGIVFNNPVKVDVSYAGTNADPDSPSYDGSVPAFFWLNDATGMWEEVPGVSNENQKTFTVYLEHFSRYALGGRPGPGDGTADW